MKVTYKTLSFVLVLIIFLVNWGPNVTVAAEGKSINLKYIKMIIR